MKTLLCLAAVLSVLFMSIPAYSYAVDNEGVSVLQAHKSFTFNSTVVRNLSLLREIVAENKMWYHLNTLGSIMMVESSGENGRIGLPHAKASRRSYGLMQLTIPTARVLFRDNVELREQYFGDRPLRAVKDDEVKKMLLTDNRLNITLGVMLYKLYIGLVEDHFGVKKPQMNLARVIAGYNMGIGNALNRPKSPLCKYVKDVNRWTPILGLLNHKLDVPVENPPHTVENLLGVNGQNQEEGDLNGYKEEGGTTVQRAEYRQSGKQCRRNEEIQNYVVNDNPPLSAE